MRQSKFLSSIVLFFFLVQSLFAQINDSSGKSFKYENEGPFVEVPAVIGMIAFSIPGMVIGVVVGLVTSPFGGAGLTPKEFNPDKSMTDWFMLLGMSAGIVGYYVIGTPFYCIKKVFWSFPKKIFSKSKKSETIPSVQTEEKVKQNITENESKLKVNLNSIKSQSTH